ncbi:Glyoxylase, beta-lactamase superfamily II [Phyllobacterium sp. YR620]|uniref:MBL fold metallo-hydrolase n=1 Tax=Phyllobacterium sp. YR620 TaxID=1881066 RepID=UPI000881A911|nr:MBL fold metallo-hydrolase [Phyllobacterium sp. YR620]SDP68230.1 Glyoxylase, beta-lactamase superfamily II [Phyllobacterium sp. YR620]
MQSFEISRRDLLVASTAAIGGLTMPQLIADSAMAAAVPQSDTPPPGFKRFKLGEYEITTVLDGLRPGDGPYPTFGANQTQEAVSQLMRANFLPETKFVNGFSPVLINTGSDLILFDTGFGAAGRENGLGRLETNMKAAGYTPDQVSIVVLTHMHGDHINGLINGDTPAFPNASIVAGELEYSFWTDPARMGTPAQNGAKAVAAKVKPLAEKIKFIKAGDPVASGITSEAAYGHTPGHMIFHIESGGKHLVITGDTANHYVASLQRPDWEVAFDRDKAMGAATRKKVFDMIATDRLPFIGYHMPFPSVGFAEKQEGGYRFVPVTYQFDV